MLSRIGAQQLARQLWMQTHQIIHTHAHTHTHSASLLLLLCYSLSLKGCWAGLRPKGWQPVHSQLVFLEWGGKSHVRLPRAGGRWGPGRCRPYLASHSSAKPGPGGAVGGGWGGRRHLHASLEHGGPSLFVERRFLLAKILDTRPVFPLGAEEHVQQKQQAVSIRNSLIL